MSLPCCTRSKSAWPFPDALWPLRKSTEKVNVSLSNGMFVVKSALIAVTVLVPKGALVEIRRRAPGLPPKSSRAADPPPPVELDDQIKILPSSKVPSGLLILLGIMELELDWLRRGVAAYHSDDCDVELVASRIADMHSSAAMLPRRM